jgi:predicted nucleic acid-binding protein
MNKVAIDTNILVYLFAADDDEKKETANLLISLNPAISSQVVSEFLNVSKRLLQLPKQEIIRRCNLVFEQCSIMPITHSTLHKAEQLINRYDFQLFDAIIVAAALQNQCTILYSEDMHHQLLVEKTLTILNPFI